MSECCDGKVIVYEHMGKYYITGDTYHKEITHQEYELFQAQEKVTREIKNQQQNYGEKKTDSK